MEDIADRLAADLADLADLFDKEDFDPELLNSVFRGAHSVKGLSGIFGFSDITRLAHQMENLLDWLRLGKVTLTGPAIKLLFDCLTLLKSLLRDISTKGQPAHGDEIETCVSRIDTLLQSTGPGVTTGQTEQLILPEQTLNFLTEYERHRLRDNLERGKNLYAIHTCYDLATFDGELTRLCDTLKSWGEIISTLPGAGDDDDGMISFEILFGTSRPLEEIRALASGGAVEAVPPRVASATGPTTEEHEGQEHPVAALETWQGAASAADASLSPRDQALSARSMSRTVRVDIGKLDELMNVVAEMALSHASIAAIARRLRDQGFSRLAVELIQASRLLERRLESLRKQVVGIRMVPLGQLYDKLSLIVRGISREQGKKIDLRLSGEETELDKLIMEDISDPMMHLVRNAVDHGIETPARRLEQGKNETGVISISARSRGNHVIIEITDDGNGIDLDRVRATALRRGLISDSSAISDREALELIFQPGFSTAGTVSDISGRGVGMDVVRNNVKALSGRIDTETRPGSGSRFTVTLPATLAITRSLIITCAGRNYALPMAAVHESLLVTGRDIHMTEERESVKIREKDLPLLRLNDYFGFERKGKQQEEYYLVVAGIGEARLGILTDDLPWQQDIIIRSLGGAFRDVPGIAGIADLGDMGSILALDVGAMNV